jgi:hypothetical protein
VDLDQIVAALAHGVVNADATRPRAISKRSGVAYQEGIGPHTESETISLAARWSSAAVLTGAHREVPYPNAPRSRCDLVTDGGNGDGWAIEVKLLRLLGDNGKPNDNILMHLLSPYPAHRSAVTDCSKLLGSGLPGRKAIVIIGYDYEGWPMDPAVSAFEVLASRHVLLSAATPARFSGLVHPVHRQGRVFAWEIS